MYPFGHMVSLTSSIVTRCGRTAALEKRRELLRRPCIAAREECIASEACRRVRRGREVASSERAVIQAGSAMNFLPLATIFPCEFSDLRPTEGAILLAVAHSG